MYYFVLRRLVIIELANQTKFSIDVNSTAFNLAAVEERERELWEANSS